MVDLNFHNRSPWKFHSRVQMTNEKNLKRWHDQFQKRMRQFQTGMKNMGVNGEIKHGCFRDQLQEKVLKLQNANERTCS